MSGCSTSVNIEVEDPHQESGPPHANSSEMAASSPLHHENNVEENKQDNIGNLNVDEEDDEDEDVDFNPFVRGSHSVEDASSSHSSEVEDLDTDADDNERKPSMVFVKRLNGRNFHVMKDSHAIGDIEHGEEIVMQTAVSSGECLRNSDTSYATITDRGSVSTIQCGNGLPSDKEKGPSSPRGACNANSRKAMVDMDIDGAISMRTRARYSLASFSLDELETFLQETDDEDDLQNVDDEEEYKKFLAAVLQGDDSPSLQGNTNVDDEDENDADFELELEEALESDHDEIEERRMTRRNKRQKASFECNKKHSDQSNRPLRPLLPFVPVGSCPVFEENQLLPFYAQSYMPPGNNGLISGFTPHQIGQLHCLIHEHVQLLIQVFSVCVLDPARGNIASEVKKLIVEMLRKRDQVLQWRTLPYPRFCFFPPYVHPSVPDELHKMFPLHGSNENVQPDISSGSDSELLCGRDKPQQEEPAGSFGTLESTSWVPYICGPVLSITDVAPLRLVGSYLSDITSAVQEYKRYQIEVGVETQSDKEPLFSLLHGSFSAEHDGQGEIEICFQDSSGVFTSSSNTQTSKKTMAANLIEKSKKQSVALVPKEIAKLARRFLQFFNPALYPRKPPPAPLVNRVLFTDSEDELLAMGLMEYNTDWKAIQQRFLPCKSSHQIFVRQKNRTSSKAPENPIKAVRRMKNSPLTSEEIARIELGFKRFKLDWISICRLFVPYRDPSLLPRQWRIATGTQKSYKADAAKNAKRRSSDLRRKINKPPVSTTHSSSEKEGDSTDNAIEETYSGDHGMYKEDEAYVHEAFLADWRPDSNVSLGFHTHLSGQGGSQGSGQKDNSGSGNFQPQRCTNTSSSLMLSNQVFLRPYRARKSQYTRLVKLAPDLPPVNLPPSVRVMTQSDFKRSLGEPSTMNCVKEENGATMNSDINNSVKCGQFRSNSLEVSAANQHNRCNQLLIGTRAAEKRSESDLQMHPLLFQASQDGSLPYYPLNCTTTFFPFFADKQPQLNLSLFHNPCHMKDAVNFLSKSSKPPEKHSLSSDIDFHPLLHDGMDLQSTHLAARMPVGAESRQRGAPNKSPLSPSLDKPSRDCSSSACASKVTSLGGKVNEVDLNSHLSSISENLEALASRLDHTRRLASGPGPQESALDGSGNKLDSGDLLLAASKNRGRKRVAESVCFESLPEIVMEQEELSDSDEEFGENVEFEHEEMADSEGEDTSDSEQVLDIPDEEIQLDEMDEDSRGNTCSTSGGHSVGSDLADKGVNNSPGALSFNLNSHPPVPQLLSPKYDFGPFEYDTLARNQIPGCPNLISSLNTSADYDENVDNDSGGYLVKSLQ